MGVDSGVHTVTTPVMTNLAPPPPPPPQHSFVVSRPPFIGKRKKKVDDVPLASSPPQQTVGLNPAYPSGATKCLESSWPLRGKGRGVKSPFTVIR